MRRTERTLHTVHTTTERRRRWRNHHRDHERSGVHRFFQHGRGGRSVRRGNVRVAILSVLQAGPMHGYQVITELETRTQGRWRPSAGSVYPTLQLLEDEGLLTSEELEGRRTYSLTDAGRSAAAENPMSLEAEGGNADPSMRTLAMSLIGAARQVERIGTPESNATAREILVDARRRIYRLLADDDAGPAAAS
jgi:DNA-binding PadR family transcriptional regulator